MTVLSFTSGKIFRPVSMITKFWTFDLAMDKEACQWS